MFAEILDSNEFKKFILGNRKSLEGKPVEARGEHIDLPQNILDKIGKIIDKSSQLLNISQENSDALCQLVTNQFMFTLQHPSSENLKAYKSKLLNFYKILGLELNPSTYIMDQGKLNPLVGAKIKEYITKAAIARLHPPLLSRPIPRVLMFGAMTTVGAVTGCISAPTAALVAAGYAFTDCVIRPYLISPSHSSV